jgi:mRNA-degrading endonuclease RelE of RelBE toxin-antitoxin system
MVKAIFTPDFKKKFEKIVDKSLKERIIKQITKIKLNPELGKPMRYSRKGTRKIYVKPHRIAYILDEGRVIFLDIYHKDEQ